MSEWVSVKDDLPNPGEKVLVFATGKANGFEGHTVLAITQMSNVMFNFTCNPYWIDPWQYFRSNYEITHWMPLPPAPKSKVEETADALHPVNNGSKEKAKEDQLMDVDEFIEKMGVILYGKERFFKGFNDLWYDRDCGDIVYQSTVLGRIYKQCSEEMDW